MPGGLAAIVVSNTFSTADQSGSWNGVMLTAGCSSAIRRHQRVAVRFDQPGQQRGRTAVDDLGVGSAARHCASEPTAAMRPADTATASRPGQARIHRDHGPGPDDSIRHPKPLSF